MRSSFPYCVPLALAASCGGQATLPATPPAANSAPTPAVSAEPVQNSTTLHAEALETPEHAVSLYFAAPELGAHLMVADPRSYRVHVISDAAGPEVSGLEVALDAGRPRTLSVTKPTILLGELLSEDAELGPGVHWLFAAPVLASGLVPRAAVRSARAAKARRFFIGKTAEESASPSAAIWLRRPDGSYNGAKNSDSVVFDAFVFSALGIPIPAPCTIELRSPGISGQLRLASPFVLHEVDRKSTRLNSSH